MMNMDVFSFVIYMIHACADKWNLPPAQVYHGMKRAGCISGYLAPHYDVLHTQGTETVVEDIREYLENRGVIV